MSSVSEMKSTALGRLVRGSFRDFGSLVSAAVIITRCGSSASFASRSLLVPLFAIWLELDCNDLLFLVGLFALVVGAAAGAGTDELPLWVLAASLADLRTFPCTDEPVFDAITIGKKGKKM
jgi:hypothetical protein